MNSSPVFSVMLPQAAEAQEEGRLEATRRASGVAERRDGRERREVGYRLLGLGLEVGVGEDRAGDERGEDREGQAISDVEMDVDEKGEAPVGLGVVGRGGGAKPPRQRDMVEAPEAQRDAIARLEFGADAVLDEPFVGGEVGDEGHEGKPGAIAPAREGRALAKQPRRRERHARRQAIVGEDEAGAWGDVRSREGLAMRDGSRPL